MYKKALSNNESIRCTQQRFESHYHNIYTQTIQKTALDNKDHKRLILFDRVTTYPDGIDKELVDELETRIKSNLIQMYY